MKITSLLLCLVALLCAASPAAAEWRQARTAHFILTIDESEEAARDFAMRLERFDAALRLLYGVSDSADRRARPISVYLLQDRLFHETCRCANILGYYSPRTTGSFIFSAYMPKTDSKAKAGGWSSQMVLLHEYSHHFMYSNFPVAYPFWYSEGFAEFNANVSFEPDGSIILGYPANYRAEGLVNGNIGMKSLFEPNTYGYPDNIDRLYGRGWLLTHYLMLNPQRKGQLARYLDAMNKGAGSLAAAQQAFGDLEKLDQDLEAYRRGKLGAPLRIPPPAEPVQVTMTTLSPGQVEMLPVYLLFIDGIAERARMGPAMRAEKVAARHPDDAVVQEQLAEIDLLADRLDRADAAADRALVLRPTSVDALVRKGQVAMRRAQDAKATDPAVWTAARAWLLKANRADPEAVMPLYSYYASFVAAKTKPNAGAVAGLMRAAVLAPESDGVRLALARQRLLERDMATARALLQPIAFAPHRKRDRNVPREIIEAIDAGKADTAIALITEDEDDKD